MTYEERTTWAQLLVGVVGTLAYLAIVIGKADGGPLVEVAYQSTMLWVIGISIVALILLSIVFSIASGEWRSGATSATARSGRSAPGWGRPGWSSGRSRRCHGDGRVGPVLDRQRDLPVLRAVGGPRARSRRSSSTAGVPAMVKPTRRHQLHPRTALRARRDDPGRAGRTRRRDPADRHRHRAGPLLALPRDGLPDRHVLRRTARRRVPVPRLGEETS